MIDALCQRYGCLPSELLAEDADLLIRLHRILAAAAPEGEVDSETGIETQLANLSRPMGA